MRRQRRLKRSIGLVGAFLIVTWMAHAAVPQWEHLTSRNGDLPAPGESKQQTASLVLDVDLDGVNDFLIAARAKAPAVLWFRRRNAGWTRYVIEPDRLPIEAGGAFSDIDGDGDPDIVFGEDASGNHVYWWENPYPDFDPGARWVRRSVKDSGANKHHDELFGDFDGDGREELVFWNQRARTLFLAEIPDDPRTTQPWPYAPIFRSAGESEGLAAADIDEDGTLDIVGGGYWFRYEEDGRFSPHPVAPSRGFTRAAAGQLIEGGRPEIVFVVGDGTGPLTWYEWDGETWQPHDPLDVDVVHGHSLQIADLNGDGHLDLFVAEMYSPGAEDACRSRILYGDGAGAFTEYMLSTGIGNHESRVADLDGDGDLDILTKPYKWDTPRVDVWLNQLR